MNKFFFDQEDYTLLNMVRSVVNKKEVSEHFVPELHPNGIKNLIVSKEMRVAETMLNFLNSLASGSATDRITALVCLYDEVVTGPFSEFRFNTARVLVQIMKTLIKSNDDEESQLRLAHMFRRALNGNPRYIRELLKKYQLVEMPESWNQLSFDSHVHDAYSRGRKTPTQIIMDAWIKGIRSLKVIYYDYLDRSVINELFKAASVLNINVSFGVEFKVEFKNHRVPIVWEPPRMNDIKILVGLLKEPKVAKLMERGKRVNEYYKRHVLMVLDCYNEKLRHEIGDYYGVSLAIIHEQDFLDFVGRGRTSLYHLSEIIYQHIIEYIKSVPKEEQERQFWHSDELFPENILQKWLSSELKSGLIESIKKDKDVPEEFYPKAKELIGYLYHIRRRSSISVQLVDLKMEDLLELLYENRGYITDLQLFNLKDYIFHRKQIAEEANELQRALNQENAIQLKKIILNIIAQYRERSDYDETRLEDLQKILYSIPKLFSYYRYRKLGTAIGSDSTSQSSNIHGMGFVFLETLPKRIQKTMNTESKNSVGVIPIKGEVDALKVYSPSEKSNKLTRFLRKLPFGRFIGYNRSLVWKRKVGSFKYTETEGNIASLGKSHNIADVSQQIGNEEGNLGYLNTKVKNIGKVLLGFTLAMSTFMFTQNWWFLAFFGAPIWFAITYIRNILQAITAGRGLNPPKYIKWKDYVNWSRVSDSLLFTGISVPLLELMVRWLILEKMLNITAMSNSVTFFIVVSTVNGIYIACHNAIRGLQKEAIIGNLFRSAIAVPVSLLYSGTITFLYSMTGLMFFEILLTAGAAIVSKMGSDTVAALIEGYADRKSNIKMRSWDYHKKVKQFFESYSNLELALPEADILNYICDRERTFNMEDKNRHYILEKELLIHSLDLMYFYMYLTRAHTCFSKITASMTEQERLIIVEGQKILSREDAIKQVFQDESLGVNFVHAETFYQSNYKEYLQNIERYKFLGA